MTTLYDGLFGIGKSLQLAHLHPTHSQIALVVPSIKQATTMLTDLQFFMGEDSAYLYPAWDILPFEHVSPQIDITATRIRTLYAIQNKKPFVIVIPSEALIQKCLPPARLLSFTLAITRGDCLNRERLLLHLEACGFRQSARVENLGTFALRGEIIDYYPSTHDHPVRLEFFDDEIEGIKLFSPSTQRSIRSIESTLLLPLRERLALRTSSEESTKDFQEYYLNNIAKRARDLQIPQHRIHDVIRQLKDGIYFPGIESLQPLFSADLLPLTDILPKQTTWIVDDLMACKHVLERHWALITERTNRLAHERTLHVPVDTLYIGEKTADTIIEEADIQINSFHQPRSQKKQIIVTVPNTELTTATQSLQGMKGFEPAINFIRSTLKNNSKILIVLASEARLKQTQDLLINENLHAEIFAGDFSKWLNNLTLRAPITLIQGQISAGFKWDSKKITLINEDEIYFNRSIRTTPTKFASHRKTISTLNKLTPSDFIVHIDFGIGRYNGLTTKTIDGVTGDFLEIEYADSNLLLPIQMIGKIQKYSTPNNDVPRLDKLSSNRWLKTKGKIKEVVATLAGDLIKLYAKRSIARGWRFEPWGAEDERFAESFPYNETPDQLKAIEDTINDMASDRPMDRLICGDVGFGKTEVAIRAAFKCVQHARQVALMAPTTLLCEQHGHSFRERFRGYPVEIGILSRFNTASQNKKTLEMLKNGTLDIVIGTHRLLSRDITFSDLGLLIIDEEQRFGVKQKERLKALKAQIDVLTLTATPIPRTLHMSLIGIRDISVISTPPAKRLAVRTYVARPEESTIRDAILREMNRAGQVFYLHNRVNTIEVVAEQLRSLVPEARVRFAHGQMKEEHLENLMHQFIKHEFDVLVSTTIIESGIDIPNANTIIISDAARYGLATLYQLRGRVGRGTRQAYAYFLTPHKMSLKTNIVERLGFFSNMEDLGLGFELAMRDLEIRGSGNLLGKEQSGHVAAVGFDLYTRILKQALDNLKSSSLEDLEEIQPEVNIGLVAYLPHHYIPDISERLLLYQRLADISDEFDAEDLADEISDRFGPPPIEVRNLQGVMKIRAMLRRTGIVKLERSKLGGFNLTLSPNAPFDIEKIMALTTKGVKLSKNLILSIPDKNNDPQNIDLDDLYLHLLRIIEEIRYQGDSHHSKIQK
jgi:transcription-repair coupling factor (superfamily II helicase)